MINQAVIGDLEFEYKVVHRSIKYPRLEIKTGDLILILPEGFKNHEEIIQKNKEWIYAKLSMINDSKSCNLNLKCCEMELKEKVHDLINFYAIKIDSIPHKITFRKMKIRWGSCDSQGNLKFNTMMKYLPDYLIEYVVFHEMAHLVEFGHTNQFWKLVSSRYKNYKELDNELSKYWFAIKRHTADFKFK
ncbi:M48 family metallopeptidase [Methanobacterium alcaliphilum]|uniref:M48 family metallopeptidase n=1 Tax=Methanobacterium alcaliphilum TaxID=392018 RepID=UPI00200A0D7B|nr:M48 family metallopeptidase [Methanobacterium alcaliphilum]MCK9151216.1 M48 family metallopeptidase [Methanobacterium alcaliphilum]